MDGNGRPVMDRLGHPHPVHIRYPLLPILEAQLSPSWTTILVHSGSPLLSILDIHSYPRWKPKSVHNGSPRLSTLGVQTHPDWKPNSIHIGCPYPSTLKSTLAHVGLPPPSTADAQSPPKMEAQSLCTGTHTKRVDAQKELGNPPRTMEAHSFRCPRDLYPNGCPMSVYGRPPQVVGAHSCTLPRETQCVDASGHGWEPIFMRGHAYKGQKNPHSL